MLLTYIYIMVDYSFWKPCITVSHVGIKLQLMRIVDCIMTNI